MCFSIFVSKDVEREDYEMGVEGNKKNPHILTQGPNLWLFVQDNLFSLSKCTGFKINMNSYLFDTHLPKLLSVKMDFRLVHIVVYSTVL